MTTNNAEDQKLFTSCVTQVQRNLKGHIQSPSTLHTLASYYTRVRPYIEGKPFCVALSYATFLFHMQMARIGVADVDLYVELISTVLSQIGEDAQLTHPFVQQVLRDHVFGLPSPTCRGGAHCVVLVPPQQYRGFAEMTSALIRLDIVPLDIVYQYQDKLEFYCNATSPLVANRALALLVKTVTRVQVEEQVTALQFVLRKKSSTINLDFLLACFERLKRAVPDPANGPTYGRALSIHCSEIFLHFRSPVRREYVERFLYPSLCSEDMKPFLEIQVTRDHLMRELLAVCTPSQSPSSPFYMCLCALLQSSFDNEIDGALEVVNCINCLMPHAAYFLSALAVDARMSVSMFAKVIIALVRGAGFAMTGRDFNDEVANSISDSSTNVYNVLYTIREVTRNCSITSSRRATEMLKALRVAVPLRTIEALGKLALDAFDGQCDIIVDPQLLCAELAMVLHQEHIDDAVQSAVDYFRDVSTVCTHCGLQLNSSLLCTVNGTVHISGHSAVNRVLSTLSECAGNKVLEEKLIGYLRNPHTQMESSVHFLVYHILSNAGQHRNALFVTLEPYIRSTLLALITADRSGGSRGLAGSEQKANALMLHVKLVILLAGTVDPSYVESILKVFSELRLRSNHDALALWCMGNILLRNCKGNVDLLPTDPQENNYCVDYPGCAPTSATCADNAQLILKLLHRSHSFSPEMNKLVGCCVCKLIQDFNMQAPNISSSLLGPFGFVTCNLDALARFALPVGSGSTFWNFFLSQMKTSAPARTAFMATLAKSIARRFRIDAPADAVTPFGVDPTGHIFAVLMYEAMKRNPALARVVLYMVCNWTKQADHTPGKFVCLTYMCVQLVTVVVERGVGLAGVELEAETVQDRQMYDQCAKKAGKILQSQQRRLKKLIPLVKRDHNDKFFHLLRRVDRAMSRTLQVVDGEVAPGDYDYDEEARQENADYSGHADMDGTGSFAIDELQQTADDSVFDTAGGYDDVADNDGDDENREWNTNYYNSSENVSSIRPRTGTMAPTQIRTEAEAVSDILAELRRNSLAETSVNSGYPRGILKTDREANQNNNNNTSLSTVPETHEYSMEGSVQPKVRSIATSPIDPFREEERKEARSHAIGRTNVEPSESVWHEPDLFALSNEENEDSPIEQHDLPRLQATENANVVQPSGMLIEYFRTHQEVDSLRHELLQLDPQSLSTQQLQTYESTNIQRREPNTMMQTVTIDARANNYARPHSDLTAPTKTVMVPVRMVGVVDRSAPESEGIIDGESSVRSVSEVPSVKRARMEPDNRGAPDGRRGMQFFMNANANANQNADSALKDMPRGGERHTPLPTEQMPPTTPYGQVVIPACLVEQRNDTAVREVRQVMANHNPNDARLSTSGKRRIHGSGTTREEQNNSTGENGTVARESSGAWWTEMSAMPMPDYAMDPQYSMELF
ncbi:hypothetical protein, conserved [Angomonas deanei]|uniref:Kinetoplastid kinetochore protein 1 n=1 Tax=Angomonas deanei TaxID=59799 RepID=A0A7G2C3M7_9TRYP|nr:hypothetical protein, conserved [Angomonas deanei]